MLIDELVKKLSADLNAENYLFQKESGAYLLSLNPEETIELIPTEVGFRLRCEVGLCPEEAEDLITSLMLANMLGQGTGRGVLSLSGDQQKIYLNRDLNWVLTYVEFKDALEAFLNFIDYWRRKIASWPS